MTGSVGIAIEVLVALLLIVTIGYCVLLNRKLGALRQDENAMRGLARELTEATVTAERAIQSLKTSAADWDRALGARMRHAERINEELGARVDTGQEMLGRLLEAIDDAGRETDRQRRSAAARASHQRLQSEAKLETRSTDAEPQATPSTARASTRPKAAPAPSLAPTATHAPKPRSSSGRTARVERIEQDDRLGPASLLAQDLERAADDPAAPVAPQRFDNDDRLRGDLLDDARTRLRHAGQRRVAG